MREPVDHPLLSATNSDGCYTPDRLRHSLLSQAGAQVFKLVLAIGIGAWTARYLGPQNLGKLSYVTALVGLLGPFGNLGVNGSLSAMLCEDKPLPGLLGSALLIELVGRVVVALFLIPFAWSAKGSVMAGLIALAVVGNLLNSSEVFEVELLNRHKGIQLARVSTIQAFAGTLLSVMALLFQAPLLVFGSLPTLQAAIRAWMLAAAVQSAKPFQLLKQVSWVTCRSLIQRGWPLFLSGLSVMLYMKSDLVMLEWLRGQQDVGQYSVALRSTECLYFFPVIVSSTFLPMIGRGTGQLDTDSALRQLYRTSWFLGLGMTLTSMLLLPPLVPLVFGREFLPSQAAVYWLGPSALSVSMGLATDALLNTQGEQKFIAIRTAIGAICNVFLNFLLIPAYGIKGAAIATSLSQFIVVYICSIMNKRLRKGFFYLLVPL
jgi:O-antigen/teichoic acid export membrane protein